MSRNPLFKISPFAQSLIWMVCYVITMCGVYLIGGLDLVREIRWFAAGIYIAALFV